MKVCQFCEQIVLIGCVNKGERRSKILNVLRTSFMYDKAITNAHGHGSAEVMG